MRNRICRDPQGDQARAREYLLTIAEVVTAANRDSATMPLIETWAEYAAWIGRDCADRLAPDLRLVGFRLRDRIPDPSDPVWTMLALSNPN